MTKRLILFTSGFPFGNGESFLETEIDYLSKSFDQVLIYCPKSTSNIIRTVPENCFVKTFSTKMSRIEKLRAFFGLLNVVVWKELQVIRKVYSKKLSLSILKTMLISYFQGIRVKRLCQSLVNQKGQDDKFYFYSYWCDDSALGLALFRDKNQEYKCFSRMHGWDVYFEVSKINYLPFRHFIADNLTALFPISQKGMNYMVDTWKIIDSSKIHVSRLGVQKQEFMPNPFPVFTLVSCSNMIPLKRIHLIVEALSEIKDVQIQWFHFGDGPLMNEIMSIAKKSLPKNVQANFMGRINNQELMEWYSAHQPDVFMNVSSSEGIPVSIMEAMSFGIPAIATDVGGTAELVNEENGYLLQTNPQVQQIENAIRFFTSLSSERRMKFSNEAKNKWEKDFSAEWNYNDFTKKFI